MEYARIKDDKLQSWINERLNNKDLNRPDYDHITADEEISTVQTEQATIAEVNAENEENVEDEPVIDDAYGKIDVEGIEEITGNYNGK
ncbi:MAG: hypothetical protein K2N23_01840 [Clostridia bacterium]|nr:hypothetical protein [Clostridia bacterium]